jgi:hypothetical protein
MRKMLYTFLNLEITVSMQMQPMVVHLMEGSEELRKPGNVTLGPPNTISPLP